MPSIQTRTTLGGVNEDTQSFRTESAGMENRKEEDTVSEFKHKNEMLKRKLQQLTLALDV